MNDSSKKDPIQIQTPPLKFELNKFFGPQIAYVSLSKDVVKALVDLTDELLEDHQSTKWGKNLAGIIKEEVFIYKEDMIRFGLSDVLENYVKTYVINASKIHEKHEDDLSYQSMINAAWIVSQYENEYNPVHGHTYCDISAVLYLKTPNVKNRRGLKDKADTDSHISFIYNASSQRDQDILDRGIVTFDPKVGDLYIFPSYLLHTVYPFIGSEERRSVAFNAIYRISRGSDIIYGNTTNYKKEQIQYLKKRAKQ